MGKFDNKNISILGLGNIGHNIGQKLIEKIRILLFKVLT